MLTYEYVFVCFFSKGTGRRITIMGAADLDSLTDLIQSVSGPHGRPLYGFKAFTRREADLLKIYPEVVCQGRVGVPKKKRNKKSKPKRKTS